MTTAIIIHGTNDAYQNHHCRCADCKAAHSRYMARWRAKGGAPVDRQRRYERNKLRQLRLGWAWITENHPDVAEAIRLTVANKEEQPA